MRSMAILVPLEALLKRLAIPHFLSCILGRYIAGDGDSVKYPKKASMRPTDKFVRSSFTIAE